MAICSEKYEFCVDLSQNGALRTLETTAEAITNAGYRAPEFLKTALSSIAHRELLNVVVIYRGDDLGGWPSCPTCTPDPICSRHSVQRPMLYFPWQLRVIRELHSAREFLLAFCAEVYGCMVGIGVPLLTSAVKKVEENGGFGYLAHKPKIICEVRSVRTRLRDYYPGTSNQCFLASSL